jgi:hypothetical protein
LIRRTLFGASLCLLIATLTNAQQPNRDGFKIDGRLVDGASDQPIPHARVAIAAVTQRNDFTTIITAENGLFSFSGLKPGKYTLSAQAHSYVFQSFNQHDRYSSSIVVGENANSSGLVFRLYKENVIDGTVTDEAGEPVRDAQITLYQTGTAGGSAGTRVRSHGMTNDEGHYHLGHLSPGDYMISLVARVWYARRRNFSKRNLDAGIGSIQGATFSSSNSLVVGGDAGDSASSEPETPNALDLAYPTTFFPGVTEAGSASVIHLMHGEKYVADFNLQPVRALHLKVAGPENPQGQLNFQLAQKMIDGTTTPVPTQSTRLPNGEWETDGIAPGQYTLTTSTYTPPNSGGKPGPMTQTSTTREINAIGNDVVDDGKTTPAAVVKAKLLFDPGASVTTRSYLQLYNFKTTRNIYELIPENGEIEFKQTVPPGSYEISIYGVADAGSFIRSIVGTGARTYGRTVVIKGATPVKIEIKVGKNQGRITGIALRDGQALAGVMIVAVPNDPVHNQVLFRRDQSDSDGTFSLPNVVPGDYTLLAIENGWDLQWTKPEVLKPYLAQGEALKVEQNGKYDFKLNVQ